MYIYPRLARGFGLARLAEVREIAENDPERIVELVTYHHPNAAPVATGGTLATAERLRDIREEVGEAVSEWRNRIIGSSSASFDSKLGASLHQSIQIVPADAAAEDVWTFLTLMVFPDFAYQRFPNLPDARCIGTARNVLRRVWVRYEILGDLLEEGSPILGEDELVGLFERTALARNRRLVRALAETVLEYAGNGSRSEFARKLYRRAVITTGPQLLDLMEPEELRAYVDKCAKVAMR